MTMTNTQTTESVDLEQESFTATIDPAKVDADNLETLGRFLDDDDLEKLAGGESFTVTIHRSQPERRRNGRNWKNSPVARGGGRRLKEHTERAGVRSGVDVQVAEVRRGATVPPASERELRGVEHFDRAMHVAHAPGLAGVVDAGRTRVRRESAGRGWAASRPTYPRTALSSVAAARSIRWRPAVPAPWFASCPRSAMR